MKLTREQVSQLSDVELNRAMIWCYNRCADIYPIVMDDQCVYCDYKTDIWFDYLTDYNLTMPLAISNNVWLQPDCTGDGFKHAYDDNFSAKSKVPLRAICEVLLMIAMEREA